MRRVDNKTGRGRAILSLNKLRSFWATVEVPLEQDRRAAERRYRKKITAHMVKGPGGVLVTPPDRKVRQRELLERQARREKSGFYEGTMALAHIIGQRFGRLRRRVTNDDGKLVRMI